MGSFDGGIVSIRTDEVWAKLICTKIKMFRRGLEAQSSSWISWELLWAKAAPDANAELRKNSRRVVRALPSLSENRLSFRDKCYRALDVRVNRGEPILERTTSIKTL